MISRQPRDYGKRKEMFKNNPLHVKKISLIIWANTKCHINNKLKKMVSNIFKVTTKWP